RELRQLVEQLADRRQCRCDPSIGERRHTEARRYADPLDPRKLAQVTGLTTYHRDLRLVDLLETHYAIAQRLPPLFARQLLDVDDVFISGRIVRNYRQWSEG